VIGGMLVFGKPTADGNTLALGDRGAVLEKSAEDGSIFSR
jgi:hypothetical protein